MVRGLSFRGCPAAQVSFRPRPDVLPLHKEGPGRGEAQCGLMRQQALPERPWGCRWLLLTQDDGLFQLGVGVRSATSGLVLPVCVPAGRWASSVLPPLHPPAEERSPVSHSQGPVRFLSTPRCSTYAHVVRALLQGLVSISLPGRLVEFRRARPKAAVRGGPLGSALTLLSSRVPSRSRDLRGFRPPLTWD